MTRVALVGLGRMGRPMAANLVAAGFDLTVHNRTRAKALAFADDHNRRTDALGRHPVSVAESPAEAARGCAVLLTTLADDAAVRSSYLDADGIFAGLGGSAVAVDMSTVSPGLARELHAAAELRGLAFLDVPVSGSVDAAEAATLTLMAGGAQGALERARPVLDALGSPLILLGAGGSGAAMKLAVNAVIHSLNQAVAEALALATAAGIPADAAYRVLEESAAAAPMVGYRKRQYLDPDAPVTFTLALARKDVRLALELAETLGTPMTQARANLKVLDEAVADGYGDGDMAAVAHYLRRSRQAPRQGGS